MKPRKFEHGDQVEVRVILWYTPGEHLLQGRVVNTQWRGDIAVHSEVGKRTTLRNWSECAMFTGMASIGTWTSFLAQLPHGEQQELSFDDAPGPLVE